MDDEAFLAALARVAPELLVYAAKLVTQARVLNTRRANDASRKQRSRHVTSRLSRDTHSYIEEDLLFESKEKKESKKVSEERCHVTSRDVTTPQFDEFWDLYPNKVGKPKARQAFTAAIRKVSLADLIVGVRRYMVHKPADRQWLNPATFLNQERWADQPAKVESNGNGRAGSLLATIDRVIEANGGSTGYVPGSGGPRPLDLDIPARAYGIRSLPKG